MSTDYFLENMKVHGITIYKGKEKISNKEFLSMFKEWQKNILATQPNFDPSTANYCLKCHVSPCLCNRQ